MRVHFGMVLVAGTLLAVSAVGCNEVQDKAANGASPSPAATTADSVAVNLFTAQTGTLVEEVSLTGHLRAVSKAQVFSRIGGRVEKVNFREGDRVSKGDALLSLESSALRASERQALANLQAAQARLGEAEKGVGLTDVSSDIEIQRARQGVFGAEANTKSALADYNDAVHNLKRQKDLFAKDAVSLYSVEQAELRAKVAGEKLGACRSSEEAAREAVRIAEANRRQVGIKEAEVDACRAAVEQAKAAVESVQVDLRDTVLRAPCSGTIVARNVEPGQSVSNSGGTVLMQIVDNSLLEMVAPLAERYRRYVKPGTSLKVKTSLADATQARVVDIIPASDPSTHSVKVRLQIANSNGMLVEGAYASAILPVRNIAGVVIPRTAITDDGSKIFCVVNDNGVARRAKVEIIYHNDLSAVVKGVSPGESLVTSGGATLSDGMHLEESQAGSEAGTKENN